MGHLFCLVHRKSNHVGVEICCLLFGEHCVSRSILHASCCATYKQHVLKICSALGKHCSSYTRVQTVCLSPLQALLPSVVHILTKGKDNALALGVLEGFLLLAGDSLPAMLRDLLPALSAAIKTCVEAAAERIAAAEPNGNRGRARLSFP